MNAPTPGEFAKALADHYAPAPDPLNPFIKPSEYAARRLTALALVEVWGEQHPLSQLVLAYANYDRTIDPPTDFVEEKLDEMRSAWETLEQDMQS